MQAKTPIQSRLTNKLITFGLLSMLYFLHVIDTSSGFLCYEAYSIFDFEMNNDEKIN
jgi:hypothetical protein